MNYPIIFFVTLLTFGCTSKPIDIARDTNPSRIVIASQVIGHSTIVVNLSRSFSTLNGQIPDSVQWDQGFLKAILIEDAIVTITYSGRVDTLSMIAPGVYLGTQMQLRDDATYTLYAYDSQLFQSVTATTRYMPQVKFDTVFPRITKSVTDTAIKIAYSLSDDPAAENYYLIDYVYKTNIVASPGGPVSLLGYATKPGRKNLTAADPTLLSDDSFTNGQYSGEKRLEGVGLNDSVAVVLSHISKEYFAFLKLRKGNTMIEMVGEPVNYPTNVKNGYGYFNACYPTVHCFALNKH